MCRSERASQLRGRPFKEKQQFGPVKIQPKVQERGAPGPCSVGHAFCEFYLGFYICVWVHPTKGHCENIEKYQKALKKKNTVET